MTSIVIVQEASIANPLPRHYANIGMPPTVIVEESEHDPAYSSGPARLDVEEGPGFHYINPSIRDEHKKINDFEVRYSFRRSCRVIVPSHTDVVDNPRTGIYLCVLRSLRVWHLVSAS